LRGRYNKTTKLRNIQINHDCRLTLQNGEYYLHIPTESIKTQPSIGGIISLDSGIRTFQTGYVVGNGEYTVEIGEDCSSHFRSQLKLIDRLYSASRSSNNRKRKKLFSRAKRINTKINHKIDDLHWKTIHYLTQNYKTIVISEFKVGELLRNKKLNRHSKRVLSLLSHYRFGLRLREKCKQRGNELYFVDESYTSKTCTGCGELNHTLGSSKHYICSGCGLEIDQDINGARNILIKNWNYLQFPVSLHAG
jgi:putative transposase